LSLGLAWLLGSMLTSCGDSGADRFWEEQHAAWKRQWQEYSTLRAARFETLLVDLQAVRGEQMTPRPASEVLSPPEREAHWPDTSLQTLLSRPQSMMALDLMAPRYFREGVDIPAQLGSWRCVSGLQTDQLSVATLPAPFQWPRGPVISCDSLQRALVVREGSVQGDWLFYLPDEATCHWLYVHTEFAPQCVDSLKEWVAASIVGARSRGERLIADEKRLVDAIHRQAPLDLHAGIAELRSSTPNRGMDQRPLLPDTPRVAAEADYPAAIQQLGDARPAAILSIDETRLTPFASPHYGGQGAGYNSDTALLRLWRNDRFTTIRLRPQDYARAVIVVAHKSVGPMVLQLPLPDGRAMYVYLRQRRAFLSFKEWIDYARAQERVWEKHPASASNPTANMPFG
jgi:hypothetical protein